MEISGNLAAAMEITNSQGIVSESVGEKSCQGNCLLQASHLGLHRCFVDCFRPPCVACLKYFPAY